MKDDPLGVDQEKQVIPSTFILHPLSAHGYCTLI
jgi:hypothetical protein